MSPRKKARPRPGPKPTGARLRTMKLTDEEWDQLAAIALELGLGDGRGGRTDAVQWLIAEYRRLRA
jgi:hypothetical protein